MASEREIGILVYKIISKILKSPGTVKTSPTFVDSSNAQVTILEDLEYYVHQYDNALLFADLGGVKDIVTPSLNSRYGLGLMPIWQSLDLLTKRNSRCV